MSCTDEAVAVDKAGGECAAIVRASIRDNVGFPRIGDGDGDIFAGLIGRGQDGPSWTSGQSPGDADSLGLAWLCPTSRSPWILS